MPSYTVSIPAGPIWNNELGQSIGRAVATAHGGNFDGNWRTVIPGQMSTVDVVLPGDPNTGKVKFKLNMPAGPLYSDEQAQALGPNIAASYGGRYTGVWHTIIEGKMSVIEVEFSIT